MKTKNLLVVLFSVVALFACNNAADSSASASSTDQELEGNNRGQAFVEGDGFDQNVLQVAIGNEDFSTLVAAVQAAGVENALVNAGPLTVFAPNNAAFAKLPEGTVETLVKPENKEKLGYILVNHVAPANYTIKTLKKQADKGNKLFMASGEYVEVTYEGEDVFVGGTKILATVNVSNGIIYVIEDLILPAEK